MYGWGGEKGKDVPKKKTLLGSGRIFDYEIRMI